MIPVDKRRSFLARQVGTLALCHAQVPAQSPMAILRAVSWSNALGRLGVCPPLFLVHDLGLLLTTPLDAVTLGPRPGVLDALSPSLSPEARGLLRQYHGLLESIASSEVVEKATAWRMRDELVAALLLRILGDLQQRFRDPARAVGQELLPLDATLYQDLGPDQLAAHYADFDAAPLHAFLRFVVESRLKLLTQVELLDVDALRLLGVFGVFGVGAGAGAGAGAADLVDLLAVLRSSEAGDVADFSLELMPSVLETRRATGVQTFSVDGYASIERRGNLDSLLPTELGWDPELFERKAIDNELYYYGREKQRDEQQHLRYLLIDSSPSMRGVRQVFARGLALALGKKLGLAGDEVWVRFFDSRLYETRKLTGPESAVPYVLGFKSERGRNYGKVFRQLLVELSRLRREERRQVVVYIITHGQCHLPVELVEALAREAYLYGIFILPSSALRLEYLDALHRYQIVDEAALVSPERRKGRALDILLDAERRSARTSSGAVAGAGAASGMKVAAGMSAAAGKKVARSDEESAADTDDEGLDAG